MKGVVKIIEATIGLILVLTILLYLHPIEYETTRKPYFNFTLNCDPRCTQEALNGIVAKKFIVGIEPYYYKRICFVNNKSHNVSYAIAEFNVPSWVKDCNATSVSFVDGATIIFTNNVSAGDIVARVPLPFEDIVAFDEKSELRVGKSGSYFLIEIPDFDGNATKKVYVFEGKKEYYEFAEYVDVKYDVQETSAKRVNATIAVNLAPGESKCVIVECSSRNYVHSSESYERIPYETTDSIILGDNAYEISGKNCEYQKMVLLDGINWIEYRIKVCEI